MMFSRPLTEHNRSKSKPQTLRKPPTSPVSQKHALSFKPKPKPLIEVPALINLSETIVLAGGQAETILEILPYQELFIQSKRRVVSCKIEVKDETIPHSFWLGDPQSQNLYQQFDTCLVSSASKLRIVGKCAEVERTTEVTGSLELQFQGVDRKVKIPLKMICEVPKILCLNNLQNVNKGHTIIRLPIKNKNIPVFIPFRNDSSMDLRFQVNLIGSQKETEQKYDLLTQKIMTIKKLQKFSIQLDLNENYIYSGPNPQIYTIRRVIQIKLAGCKQFFTFPLEVLVYQNPQTL